MSTNELLLAVAEYFFDRELENVYSMWAEPEADGETSVGHILVYRAEEDRYGFFVDTERGIREALEGDKKELLRRIRWCPNEGPLGAREYAEVVLEEGIAMLSLDILPDSFITQGDIAGWMYYPTGVFLTAVQLCLVAEMDAADIYQVAATEYEIRSMDFGDEDFMDEDDDYEDPDWL